MDLNQRDAINTVKTADKKCYSSFIEYERIQRGKTFLDPDDLTRQGNDLAQSMALASEYYIKAIILKNINIKVSDEMKSFLKTRRNRRFYIVTRGDTFTNNSENWW